MIKNELNVDNGLNENSNWSWNDSKSISKKYAKELSAPLSVQIEVTSSCNVSCIHCYNTWQTWEKIYDHLDIEKADRIVSQLVENWVFSMWITWWEPLIKKEVTSYLIEQWNKHWLTTRLNSNLMLLTPEIAKEFKSSKLRSILTSLTSFDEETHDKITWRKWNFKKVIEGIQIALDENIKTGVNMVVTKLNRDHIYKTWEFLHWLWVKSFFATKWSWPVNIPNFEKYSAWKDDIINSLHDLIKVKDDFWMNVDILECYPLCLLWEDSDFSLFSSHKCTAWITSLTIWANWEVRACNHADKSYWNIFKEDLSSIWKRMQEWRTGELLPEKCISCEYLFKCTWWCRMDAHWCWDIKMMDPFAKPENIPKIAEMLKVNEKNTAELYWKIMRIDSWIVFREENGCYIINKWVSNAIITKDSWILLQNLLKNEYFTIDAVSKEFDIDIKILNNFFNTLLNKNFIKII